AASRQLCHGDGRIRMKLENPMSKMLISLPLFDERRYKRMEYPMPKLAGGCCELNIRIISYTDASMLQPSLRYIQTFVNYLWTNPILEQYSLVLTLRTGR